jgi:putative peptidoglycan lipid II flippase
MNDSDGLQNVVRSTGIISVAIMVSRVLGLVREQVVAYFFGSTVVTDAFYAAFPPPPNRSRTKLGIRNAA